MNEIPGHQGWYYTTIDPAPDDGLETEVYFQRDNHDYPGILVRGCDRKALLHNAAQAIKRQTHLFPAKL